MSEIPRKKFFWKNFFLRFFQKLWCSKLFCHKTVLPLKLMVHIIYSFFGIFFFFKSTAISRKEAFWLAPEKRVHFFESALFFCTKILLKGDALIRKRITTVYHFVDLIELNPNIFSFLEFFSEMAKNKICFFYHVWLLTKSVVFGSFWEHASRNPYKLYIFGFSSMKSTKQCYY